MIVTVTPNPSLDRTLVLDVLRLGELNRATAVRVEPSGKGVNVSRALHANGVDTVAVLPVGGAEGDQLLALLAAEGVAHGAVRVDGSVRVNVTIQTSAGTTKTNEPGPRLTTADATLLRRAARLQLGIPAAGQRSGRVGAVPWVVGAGTLAPGLPVDFYAALARDAHARGARVALDTSGAALAAGCAGRPDLLAPNLWELAQLTATSLATVGDAVAAARVLGVPQVLVTLGPDGALLVSAGGAWHATVGSGAVVSTVGGGDNALAGFLAAATGLPGDPSAALREAVAWASVAVQETGSLARPVGPADRAAVRVTDRPDPRRALSAAAVP